MAIGKASRKPQEVQFFRYEGSTPAQLEMFLGHSGRVLKYESLYVVVDTSYGLFRVCTRVNVMIKYNNGSIEIVTEEEFAEYFEEKK